MWTETIKRVLGEPSGFMGRVSPARQAGRRAGGWAGKQAGRRAARQAGITEINLILIPIPTTYPQLTKYSFGMKPPRIALHMA